jgi:hypothetical protein
MTALTTGFGDYVGGGSRRGRLNRAESHVRQRGRATGVVNAKSSGNLTDSGRQNLELAKQFPSADRCRQPMSAILLMDRASFSNAKAYPERRPRTTAAEKQKTMESKQCRSAG